jgi:UV DNA damage endonuclease
VGGAYGDRPAALDRWALAWERLSEPARRRVVVEHDERLFDLADVLELHRRVGVRVVFDLHHHRLNPAPGLEDPADALAAAYATWPADVRPKAHLSSPRTDLPEPGVNGRLRLPRLDRHADVVPPWELAQLLAAAPGPLDVMLEAKAKDLAVLALRAQLERLDPGLAAAEERGLVRA